MFPILIAVILKRNQFFELLPKRKVLEQIVDHCARFDVFNKVDQSVAQFTELCAFCFQLLLKVSQDSPQNLQLKIDYENCNLTAGSKAGNTILFDQEGYIEVHGESAEYNFEMTYDKDYPTDWFAIQIKGNGADVASLKQVNHGYVLSSDSLNGVEVKANNFDVIATVSFSTDYDSVFLYEINETTIGVLVDTDSNGTYETNLLTGKSADTRILGDVDSSDDVEIRDATWIQRHIVSLEIPFAFDDTVADVDCNEDVNIMDVTAIQYYLANMKPKHRVGMIIG